MSELPPPCQSCGACCFSQIDAYVRVLGSDHARLREGASELTHFIGNQCYMKMADGHCAALVLEVTTGRFVCSVYETRPDVCRDLERASPQCAAEIHEKGGRPLALLQRLGSTR
ncbi:MAG: YkgJ family cysteine cluster protein [Polyangiaceae bacterium]